MEEFPFTDYYIKTSGRGAARVCMCVYTCERSFSFCASRQFTFIFQLDSNKQLSLLHSIELNFRITTKKVYHIAKL